jgi:hypothetical protein
MVSKCDGAAFLLYFHGEQLVPIFLGVFIAIAILVVLCSWLLVHYLRRRIGAKAYVFGAVPLIVAGVLAFAASHAGQANEGPPKVIAAAKLPGIIHRLPAYAPFSLSGISYFDGKLYVGTNVGVVQLSAGKVTQVYQFQPSDSVVSGPWLDRSDHLLWATDDHTGELLAFDGKDWRRMREPTPSKGYYSRADVLEGVRPVGNPDGFWLAAGGSAWKWNSNSGKWDQISQAPAQPDDYNRVNEIIGVLPVGKHVLLITRHQPLPFLVKAGEEFNSDELISAADPTSAAIARDGEPFLADTWTAAADTGYICSKDHRLFSTTGEHVTLLSTPGPCEDISTDERWNLIVSVKSKGVFRYTTGNWTLLAASPYPSGAGEYSTHLSASAGQLALALDAKPVVDRQHSAGRDMQFTRDAPTALWVLMNREFSRVTF